MPELPEVETVRRDIHDRIVGQVIDSVLLGRLRSVRRYLDPQEFIDDLVGSKVINTDRLGKYLFIDLDGGARLVVHLRMSGQLRWVDSPNDPLEKHTHVRLQFGNGRELRFIDPRTFGEMFVISADSDALSHLGPDAWNGVKEAKALATRLMNRRGPVKSVLLDQSVVAGIGSIYADEICFRAGVRPARATDTLRPIDIRRLHVALKDVLGEAIAARGSTLGDGQYVGADGQPGTFASAHRVHARRDRPCVVCDTPVASGTVGQRSAYWCPRCQR
jgi:formamidopyrimidine-DNA glycosylase